MNRKKTLLAAGAAIALLVAGGGGYWLTSGNHAASAGAGKGGVIDGVVQDASGRRVKYWFDPMLPAERYNAPGKSSMNMDLMPKYADEAGDNGIAVSSQVQQNLGVRTTRVAYADLSPSVSVVGRVEVDERRIVAVQTLTPGFVEQLNVRAVGEQISAGSRVASVYSPELLGAQHEYSALLRVGKSTITPDLQRATRQRLTLLGLPEGTIRNLDRGGAPQRTYGVFAPRSGVVTEIGARPGARVELGQSILTLADLSQVLVVAEVPEVSLGQVKVGQQVQISFPSYPGEVRQGRVDYIFPTLDPEARTARVRVILPNGDSKLKIGMFANMTITGSSTNALVVPTEAVISTGKRNVVIAQRNGSFIPVEVQLGRTVGEKTEIQRGLAQNDVVVVSGQFLIDSEASLAGLIERLSRGQPAAVQGAMPANMPMNMPMPGGAAQQKTAAAGLIEGTGTIKSLDTAGSSVTLAHGPLPALGWPAMTMTFPVENASLLRGHKAGERVRFGFKKPDVGKTPVISRISVEGAQ